MYLRRLHLKTWIGTTMRSTLSCSWCRRSKVKCSQHDGEKPCRLCVRAGRTRDQCVLEQLPPKSRSPRRQALRASMSRPVSRDIAANSSAMTPAGNGPPIAAVSSHTYSYKDEPLFHNISEHVVTEVVEAFTRKFPELSFVLVTDFMQQLRTSPRRIHTVKLAAIFALCARLTDSVPKQGLSPHAVCQQYAAFVQQNIWPQIVCEPGVETIQCLLLIAQYEWGEGNGFSTWMYAGIATRMFQGLQAGSDTSLSSEEHVPQSAQSRETVWKHEIQRRTIWACFIMDRTVSCGRDRPVSLDTSAMTIYLPASEDDFDLGTPTSEPSRYDQLLNGSLSPLDRRLTIGDYYTVTIRSLDVFARACKWVAGGGRRQVSVLGTYPWQPESPWHQIKTELSQLRKLLHDRLKYPQTPVYIYVHRRQCERFAFVNLIYYLSVVILYREYIPFIPLYLSEMRGPVEPPLLTQDAPPGWWNEYTEILFDAATQITRLLIDLKAANITFQTPIVGYSVFSAASMHVYLAIFPWVDPRSSAELDAAELSKQDLQYLHDFAQMWPLGKAWLQVARQTQILYRKIVLEGSYSQYQNNVNHLRKIIEQYGTLCVPRSGNEDGNEGVEAEADTFIIEPSSPLASIDNPAPNSYNDTARGLPDHTFHQNQPILSDETVGESRIHHGGAFVNDWSTWGQESLMGQQVGPYFYPLGLSQGWNELL